MSDRKTVLCGASSYEEIFYFNPLFNSLPEEIKKELNVLCVLFTEDVGGILRLEFEEDGTLDLTVDAEENDFLFDEIGSVLRIKELRMEKQELFENLEMYYKVFFLGKDQGEKEDRMNERTGIC